MKFTQPKFKLRDTVRFAKNILHSEKGSSHSLQMIKDLDLHTSSKISKKKNSWKVI